MALTTPNAHERELSRARNFLEAFPEFGLKEWDYAANRLTPTHPDGQTCASRQRGKRTSSYDATVVQRCPSPLNCGHVLPRQTLTDAEVFERVNLPAEELRALWNSALRRPRWCRACESRAKKLAVRPRVCAAEDCDNILVHPATGRPRKYCEDLLCELRRDAARKRHERAA